MSSDQASRGFLPPSTTVFTDGLHRQPPSSSTAATGSNPPHLPGFTTFPLPQTSPTIPKTTSEVSCTSQESQLAAALGRAILKIRDAVAGATTVDTPNPIRRTKPDINSSPNQKHQTTTARRNPLRPTMSDTITPPPRGTRTVCPSPISINTAPESSYRDESPQIKRLRKMEEMVTKIVQRCWEFRRESELAQGNVGDDNPNLAIMKQDKSREECVGFKRLDEGQEECVGFKRLDDGGLRIQMRCSCHKRFEVLHNHIGCFYRLI